MNILLVKEPSDDPVTVSEAKDHMRVSHSADDGYIESLILAATNHIESVTSNKIVKQTWNVYFDKFPLTAKFVLPFGKLQSVTHIKYTNTEGLQVDLPVDDYMVDTISLPGTVRLAPNKTWPHALLSPVNAIEIQFVTGYNNVPFALQQAVKIYVAHLYDNREPVIVGTTGRSSLVVVPMSLDALLGDYRMLRLWDGS